MPSLLTSVEISQWHFVSALQFLKVLFDLKIKKIYNVEITCSKLSITILLHLLRPSWLAFIVICPLPRVLVDSHTGDNPCLSPRSSPRQNCQRSEVSGTSFPQPHVWCIPTLSKSALTCFNHTKLH